MGRVNNDSSVCRNLPSSMLTEPWWHFFLFFLSLFLSFFLTNPTSNQSWHILLSVIWLSEHQIQECTIVNISSKIMGFQKNYLFCAIVRWKRGQNSSFLITYTPHKEFQSLPSATHFRFPSVKTNRYKAPFIPTAITHLNAGKRRQPPKFEYSHIVVICSMT